MALGVGAQTLEELLLTPSERMSATCVRSSLPLAGTLQQRSKEEKRLGPSSPRWKPRCELSEVAACKQRTLLLHGRPLLLQILRQSSAPLKMRERR